MKLYATVTSERATKSQGGKEYLRIVINDENRNNICSLDIENRKSEIYIELLNYSNGEKHIITSEKAKKQKAEHIHDWDNYGKCCICGKWDIEGERLP